MAYLVKETLTSEPRRYVLDGIIGDHSQKVLAGEALVRDETQDIWYSVAELIGVSPTPQFRYLCHQCKSLIQARKIDLGLKVKCPQCSQLSVVPDVKAQQDTLLNKHLLKQAAATTKLGAFLFLLGGVATIASFTEAFDRGRGFYAVFWGLIVVGAVVILTGLAQRRSYYQRFSQATGQRLPQKP
ncbi:MAG TPA: hypothetical protein VD994_02325 [Prosthecobacter sp.]|nr:hypothetical protein [Prosthecobacter sp.]